MIHGTGAYQRRRQTAWCIESTPATENQQRYRSVLATMKIRRRLALLISALSLVVVAGCTQPAGTSGPGASTQPAASGNGDYGY